MLCNYHAHTPRCMHATGTEEEYVRAAIGSGFDTLGFSDHTPWVYEGGFVSTMRMRADQLDGYVRAVREAGERHKDAIRVLCGLECEYFPAHLPWLLEQKEKLGIDYLLLGNHFDQTDDGGMYFGRCAGAEDFKRYIRSTVAGMQSGLFLYLAHPDLFLSRYPVFDADCRDASVELCRAAKALNTPLEVNVLGMRYCAKGAFPGALGYPCWRFWEIAAQEGARVIIGMDAHAPEHLSDMSFWRQAEKEIAALGITPLESLPIPAHA